MRKLLSIILAVLAISANARHITSEKAGTIAADFLNTLNSNVAGENRTTETRAKARKAETESSTPYYVFNADNDRGFVIISADDRGRRILGYSDKGRFDFNNLPPQLAALLEQYAEQIAKLPAGQQADPSWSEPAAQSVDSEGVLLATPDWGQGAPYNSACPEVNGERCLTGCVATAMAIVMKYNNWPPEGRYKWSYSQGDMEHEVDFSQSKYNFSGFKDKYSDDEPQSDDMNNLAKLMYDCGVAAAMSYSVASSAARTDILGHILMRFFKYSPECQHLYKRYFSNEEWFNLITENLTEGHPVLYGARSENIGHEFVIDGFQGNMFHINWGWDGLLNGYYSLEGLTPDPYNFSDSHDMVINIIPDKSEKEYAEIWSNIGLFHEATIAPMPGEDDGHGMEIGCENVTPGIPFSVITAYLSGPANFVGDIALAVVDQDNQIIDIVSKKHIDEKFFPGDYYPYVNQVDAHNWPEVVYNGEVADGYRLQLVAKRDVESDWLFVTQTMQSPSSLPLTGNRSTVIKENVTYHCLENERMDVSYISNMIRLGQNLNPHIVSRNGVAHLYIDGTYAGTASDYNFAGIAYYPETTAVNVDVYYSRYENLDSKTLHVQAVGKLDELLSDNDYFNLFELKLTGEIDESDIITINNLKSLGILDLSEVNIAGNRLGSPIKFVQILYLPAQLTHMESDVAHEALVVDIPENVENCGRFRGSEFIKLHSKTPPGFASDFIPQLRWTILFVPTGTKEIYEADPIWGTAREIIECDEPLKASWNFPYLNLNDSLCALSYGHNYEDAGLIPYPPAPWENDPVYPGRYFIIPSEVTHDGVTRKVEFIKDIRPRIIFTSAGEIPFQGRDLYFLPEEGFLKGTSSISYSGEYPMQYAITSRLTSNFTGVAGTFFVPPYSRIGMDDDLDDHNGIYERHEMFSFEKDGALNMIALKPSLKGIAIKEVLENDTPLQPVGKLASGHDIYSVDLSKGLSVSVRYDVHDLNTLTTTYPAEVLAAIPNTDFTSAITAAMTTPENGTVDIYTLTGAQVVKGMETGRTSNLAPGVYIFRSGDKVRKVVIR